MKPTQLLDCNSRITGRRISLERIGPQHVDLLLQAYSNDAFWATYRMNQARSYSRDQLFKKLQHEYERLPGQVGKIEWLISRTPMGKLRDFTVIGLASLSAFNVNQSQAELMIGFFSRDEIKTGLGLETSLLVLNFAFNLQKLESLSSLVYTDNTESQKSTLALGFVNEGTISKQVLKDGVTECLTAFRNKLTVESFRNNSRLARLSDHLLGYDVTATSKKAIAPEAHIYDIETSFSIPKPEGQ